MFQFSSTPPGGSVSTIALATTTTRALTIPVEPACCRLPVLEEKLGGREDPFQRSRSATILVAHGTLLFHPLLLHPVPQQDRVVMVEG